MHSAIYKGNVSHQRWSPRPHGFHYDLFMMYVDLDELPTLFEQFSLWNVNKTALASFKREDHFGDREQDLASCVRQLVKQESTTQASGPIRLLTHFRYFGYVFNPLSLYFCFNQEDTHVTHVVAEVSNTPWNETHCYVLSGYCDNDHFVTPDHEKTFHVSPFMNLDMSYRWHIGLPSDTLSVRVQNLHNNQKLFDAAINLKREEINGKTLMQTLINFPLMSYKVTAAIYFEALKLWLKKIKYVPYSKKI